MRRIRIPWRHARTGSTQRNGLIVALVVAVVFAGIVVWTLAGSDSRSHRSDPTLDIDAAPPPDIKSRPATTANGLPGPPEGNDFFWEIADRDDPSRRAGLVHAAKGKPGVGGSYILTSPEFTYYTKDGRLVHFTADKGEAVFPSPERGSRPESGSFEGHVVFKLFEKAQNGKNVDPAKDTPSMVGTTTRMRYDGTMGELQLPDKFEVDGERGRFVGQNALFAMNEAGQQLEWAIVDPGSVLTIKQPSNTAKDKPNVPKQASPAQPNATNPANTTGTPSKAAEKPKLEPKLAFYQVSSVGGVEVQQTPRSIRSHEARVWLKLLDNKLPEGAFATMGSGVVEPAEPPTTHLPDAPADDDSQQARATTAPVVEATSTDPAPSSNTASAPAPQDPSRPTASTDGPMTISFTGPLEIKLLTAKPEELARDDLRVRFVGDEKQRARFEDAKAKAVASGDEIDYAATVGQLSLIGKPEQPATLALGDNSRASAARFDADLTKGQVAIAGAGRLESLASAGSTESKDPAARTLTWSDSATMGFAIRDGKPTSDLEWFKPRGDVVAMDKSGTFRAREMDATFSGVPGSIKTSSDSPVAAGKRYLSKLVLRDGMISDGKQGRLEGAELTALFHPVGTGTNSTPTSVAVRGDALAISGDSMLEASQIDAALGRDDAGRTVVRHAVASGDARYEGRNGVWAKAELIDADVPKSIVDLSGPDVRLGQGKTFVQGSQMRLEGGERQRLTVFGLGRFEHEADNGAKASANWTRQMTFEDTLGRLECAGDVGAMWAADSLSRDVAKADRVKMWFTPGKAAGPNGAPGLGLSLPTVEREIAQADPRTSAASPPTTIAKADNADSSRKLLRAEATGSQSDRATIESRRFVMIDDTPALERLLYVEGDTIKADEEQGTLDVPGPGRLFTLDHRAAAAREAQAADPKNQQPAPAPASAPGSTLASALKQDAQGAKGEARFDWTGWLKADRTSREITLHDGVKLRHHRSSDGMLTDLECTDLVATLGESRRNSTPTGEQTNGQSTKGSAKPGTLDASGELRTAVAKGGVWLRNGTREITAQNLLYDAANGIVDAGGSGGAGAGAEALGSNAKQVSVFDQGSATPLTAKRIVWNLTTGRLEIKEPGTVVGPN